MKNLYRYEKSDYRLKESNWKMIKIKKKVYINN